MRFALFPNLNKPQSIDIAKDITVFLKQKGADVTIEDGKEHLIGVSKLSSFAPHEIDFLISLGGDGTILRILHTHPDLTAPIVGINLGGLGFMAAIPVPDIYVSLQDILEGRFSLQERMVMQGINQDGKNGFSVNEIVIHRERNPSLIDLAIHVGGMYLNTFSADGLIISTPNGSTAYSLAAGGPILTPHLDAFVITPICPHTISNRPIVISSDQEIQVQYQSHYEPIEVIYDGFRLHTLATGQSIRICTSNRSFNLVTFERHDFFSTLRTKLGWTGKLKP